MNFPSLTRLITAAMLLLSAWTSEAGNLDLTGYQDTRGAITLYENGVFVDPYFANKSLLAAHHAGLDIQAPARAWIEWMIQHQRQDGLFDRFCLNAGEWQPCKRADADDALLSTWLELIHVMAPPEGLPAAWQASGTLAWWRLSRLRDANLGVYRIFDDTPEALFMDNVENYAALGAIGEIQKRLGMRSQARATARLASDLQRNILKVFRPSGSGPFQISTQIDPQWRFYPEQVAQLYPMLHDMPTGSTDTHSDYRAWMRAYGTPWLNLEADFYPWGLIAITALKMEDKATAHCWAERAAQLRHTNRWHVLEEAAFQIIQRDPSPLSCPNVHSS